MLTADLRDLPLVDFLSFLSRIRMSGMLSVVAGSHSFHCYLADGRMTHVWQGARADDDLVDEVQAILALSEMLAYDRGSFSFERDAAPPSDGPSLEWEVDQILMQCCALNDEIRGAARARAQDQLAPRLV